VSNPGRFYPYDGRLYPSVTTILRAKFPGPVAEDEAQQAEWDAKRDRGSLIHGLIAQPFVSKEQWVALSLDPSNPPKQGDEERKFSPVQRGLRAWRRFVWDYRYKPELVEVEFVDPALGYGGKPDSIGPIPKGRIIADIKTGRLHREYVRYQLAAYHGLYLARYPRRHIYGALGVHLDCGTGDYEVEAMAEDELKLYHTAFMELVERVKQEETCLTQN
jgi:hypothetical protein